ncbi:MAG: Lrp/AsnC ligand binding domain-containing protein [Candidatus Hydrothermarchaeales archaeon]
MVTAGVLIKTKPGSTKRVLDAIRAKEGISQAFAVFGRYDIVVMIKDAKDLDDAARIVTQGVATIDGVASTETLVAANI